MSDQQPISLSTTGPPDTIIDDEPAEALAALEAALALPDDERRAAVGHVVTRWPRMLDAWAAFGQLATDDASAYAAFRVGYHRGLDRLRQSGWRGAGSVRWQEHNNRGFLRCLAGLQAVAQRIGESDEDERCSLFLRQLDPTWPPNDIWAR